MGSEYFFAFFLVFVLAGAFAAWLDFRRKQKLADIIKAAFEAGQPAPQQVIDALVGAPSGLPQKWWRGALPYAVLSLAFGGAGGWTEPSPTRDAFLVVAACMGLAALVALLVRAFSSRSSLD